MAGSSSRTSSSWSPTCVEKGSDVAPRTEQQHVNRIAAGGKDFDRWRDGLQDSYPLQGFCVLRDGLLLVVARTVSKAVRWDSALTSRSCRTTKCRSIFSDPRSQCSEYDAIVISDAPADSFLLHPIRWLVRSCRSRHCALGEYVAQGGGLAMVGGWMSFGGFSFAARLTSARSPAQILPVEICPTTTGWKCPRDACRKWWRAIIRSSRGLPTVWPDFLGYNRVLPKRGETVLTFPTTGDPLLIAEQAGAGRMACFTSDILPHWGSPRFLEWAGYVPFWSNFFYWVAGKALPHPG